MTEDKQIKIPIIDVIYCPLNNPNIPHISPKNDNTPPENVPIAPRTIHKIPNTGVSLV